MATKVTKIQLRRDTAANWNAAQPTLSMGEIGFEHDTYKFKIGLGDKVWEELPYFTGVGVDPNNLSEVLEEGNIANGSDLSVGGVKIVPSVAADGKVSHGGIVGKFLPGVSFRTSAKGVISEVPETDKSSIGDFNNRFAGIFSEGTDGAGANFLVFGKEGSPDDRDSGSFSYRTAPTRPAFLTITGVDEIGRINSYDFVTTAYGVERGEGYDIEDGLKATYSMNNGPGGSAPGEGFGARFDVMDIDGSGGIVELFIRDPGVGYEVNQEIYIDQNSEVMLSLEHYDGFSFGTITSPLVTQYDLQNLTTQAIPAGAQTRIQIAATAPTGESDVRTLPPTDNIQNAEDFDLWTYRSLVQLEYLKPTVRDCVNNGPLAPTPTSPENFDFLDPKVNPIAVTNIQGNKDGSSVFNAAWGNYVGGEPALGGEVIVWDPSVYTDPNNTQAGADVGAWIFAFRPHDDIGDIVLEEEDPIFKASGAFNLVAQTFQGEAPGPSEGSAGNAQTDYPHYDVGGVKEPLMLVNNWRAIGRL